MFVTGGGHGNFIWFMLFLFVDLFGLYFPLMAILAVDLTSYLAKVVFGTLIGFNLVASTILIIGWISESGANGPSDFARTVQHVGIGDVIFCAGVHFLPTIIFSFLFARVALFGDDTPNEDNMVSLKLS